MDADVKGTMENDTSDVTKGKMKKAKKHKRKHENELVREKIDDKPDAKQNEVNSNVKGEQDTAIPPSSVDVEEESVSPKKRAKKKKHSSDVVTTDVKTKDQKEEVDAHVKENDVPPCDSDITEEANSREKGKKAKKRKHKHQHDLVPEGMEIETDGKEEEVKDAKEKSESAMSSTTSNVTDQSRNRKKEKTKREKHQSDIIIEDSVETKSQEQEVNADAGDKKSNSMLQNSDTKTEESRSSEKKAKTKKKKHRHEKDITEKPEVKTEDEEKKNPDEKEKSESFILSSTTNVVEELGSREKKKKAKKRKHNSENDSMIENMQDETESKPKELEGDLQEISGSGTLPSSSDVIDKSESSKQKEKVKKKKHQSISIIDDPMETKGKENEVNTDVKDQKGNGVFPSSDIKTEESGSSEKKKKAKKHKHGREDELVCEKTEVKTENSEEINPDVKEKSESLIPSGNSNITENLGGREKKKKAKKDKSKDEKDSISEKMQDETERKENEGNADVQEKSGGIILPSTGNVGDESGGRGKRKKAKKHKHQDDLVSAEMEVESEFKKEKVKQDLTEKCESVVLPSSSDVTEQVHSRPKKDKAQNKKQQRDLVLEDAKGQEKEAGVDVKDVEQKDLALTCGDLTEDTSSHGKTKKAKKHKAKKEIHSSTGKMQEETEGEKIDVPPSGDDKTEESASRDKKKSKKHKHDHEKNKEQSEAKKESSDVTDESLGRDEKKGERTQKHQSDLIIVDTEKVKDKKMSSSDDVKEDKGTDMPPSHGDITEGSANHRKTKKAKKDKHKHEKHSVIEEIADETEGKETEVNKSIKEKLDNVVPLDTIDVAMESISRKERKKSKKRKYKSDNVNEDTAETKDEDTNLPSNNDVTTEESGNTKEGKRRKKWKYETDPETEKTEDNSKEVNTEVKSNAGGKDKLENVISNDAGVEKTGGEDKGIDDIQEQSKKDKSNKEVITKTNEIIDVDSVTENRDTYKISEVMSQSSDPNEKKETGDMTGNQWESVEFASAEKKQKFLRLMGALKPSNDQREASKYSALAMNKQQEEAFVSSLEKQYFQAMQTGKQKGVGLGYQ